MKKLLSIKSLLLTSVIAFILAFTIAPQGKAESQEKLDICHIDYFYGTLSINTTYVKEKLLKTADGYGCYFSTGKQVSNLKYTTIVTDPDSDGNSLEIDISRFIGKEIIIGVALDSNKTGEDTIRLTPSPSLKAKFEDNDIKITVDKNNISAGITSKEFRSSGYNFICRIGEYSAKAYYMYWENDYDDDYNLTTDLKKALERATILGTTAYISVQKDTETEYSPWSKEVKVKIPARAKAPKINIKTAGLTKAFEWKIGNKLEYKITVGDGTSAWKTGGEKANWQTIIDNAVKSVPQNKDTATLNVNATTLVNGDAIASDIEVQVRTSATSKKSASSISVLKLKKSPDSPTYAQIKVDATNAKKATSTVSAASISLGTIDTGYAAQYSTDGKKWKNLTKSIKIEPEKMGTNNTIQLRLIGNDKKVTALPSAVTTVTITNSKNEIPVMAKRLVSSGNIWTEQDINYSQSAVSEN